MALDPENRTEPLRVLGITLLLAGRFAESVPLLEEVQRMSGKPLSDHYLAMACYYRGDTTRAEAMLEQLALASSASNSARARSTLASILAARGQRFQATEMVRAVAVGYMDHHVAYSLGAAEAQLGHGEQAVEWLRRAMGTGFPCHPWYARDPLLDPLRTHPDFQRLMGELEAARRAAEVRYAMR